MRRSDAPPERADRPLSELSPGTNSSRHRDPAWRQQRSGRRTTEISPRCNRSHPTRESASVTVRPAHGEWPSCIAIAAAACALSRAPSRLVVVTSSSRTVLVESFTENDRVDHRLA